MASKKGVPVVSVFLIFLSFDLIFVHAAKRKSYDPCAESGTVKKDGPFLVGFAFWPNGTIEDWGDVETGVHPCDPTNRTLLVDSGALISYYNVKVDSLTLMVTSNQNQNALYKAAKKREPYQTTVVAFRGKFRSEPRVVGITETESDSLKIVQDLALVAKFDDGALQFLQWNDLGCGECFTDENSACLRVKEQSSCASKERECPTAGSCLTNFHISFDGHDKNSQVFDSGHQIRRLQTGSVSDIYKGSASIISQTKSLTEGIKEKISGPSDEPQTGDTPEPVQAS